MVSESAYEELLSQLSAHKGRILDFARMGFDDARFETFRKMLLSELGKNGFERELEEAIIGMDRDGTGRNIHAGKGVSE
jgi:hypothetical protein